MRGANVGCLAKFKDQKRPGWFKGVGCEMEKKVRGTQSLHQ